MALASNSDRWTISRTDFFGCSGEMKRDRNLLFWQFPEIVTVEVRSRVPHRSVSTVSKRALAAGEPAKNKTAPAPPAVRAPVFPHAFPVMEGLKPPIPVRGI
jgi:hypothetical protein